MKCGFANLSDAKFCSECGTKLPTLELDDSKTVQKDVGGYAFCMNCGTLLEEKRQSSTMEAEPQQKRLLRGKSTPK